MLVFPVTKILHGRPLKLQVTIMTIVNVYQADTTQLHAGLHDKIILYPQQNACSGILFCVDKHY